MADNCQMIMIKACIIPKIFEAVIGAKSASKKYWAKAVYLFNTYVHKYPIFFLGLYFLIN